MYGCKRWRHGDALPAKVHPTVVPKDVEELQERGIKRAFGARASNRFKTESVALRGISLTEKQRAFVRDIVTRRKGVKADMVDDDED